jgi:hypothetical protein
VAVLVWMLLNDSDIQFGTTFLTDDVGARLNDDRSLAFGSYLTLAGMFVVAYGLAIPLLERRRQRVVGG